MKLFKKGISFLLAVLMMTSVIAALPSVNAAETKSNTTGANVSSDDVSFESSGGSIGNMISSALEEEQNSKSDEDITNKITNITISDKTATVEFNNNQTCNIIVGIYDEEGKEMLASGMKNIEEENVGSAEVEINTDSMPQYYLVKGFMLDENNKPLSTSYENTLYTKEMQEFLAKTTDDFDSEKVYNLDNSDSDNFAVYDDEIVLLNEDNEKNYAVSVDDESAVYVFENIDENISTLKTGDVFTFTYNDEDYFVKVKSIEVDGTKATIYGDEDIELADVFSYIKIDTNKTQLTSTVDDTEDESNNGGKSNVYSTGTRIIDENAVGIEETVQKKFTNKKLGKADFTGSIDGKANASVVIYYDAHAFAKNELYVDFSLKLSLGVEFSVSLGTDEDNKLPIKLGEYSIATSVPGLTVKFIPSFVIEGKISGTMSGTLEAGIGKRIEKGEVYDTSPESSFKPEVKVEAKVFVGLSLNPKVVFLSEKALDFSLEAKVGVLITASSYKKEESETEKHTCKVCVQGEFYFNLEISGKFELLDKDFEWNFDVVNVTSKLSDFYYSSYAEPKFGLSTCPNHKYLVSFNVVDSSSNPISGVSVGSTTTNTKGQAKVFCKGGNQKIDINKTGYGGICYNFTVSKPTTLTVKLYKSGENLGSTVAKTPDNIATKFKYSTKRIYLTDNTSEFFKWTGFSVKYTSDRNTWTTKKMVAGGYNMYGQTLYYYNLPKDTTDVVFLDPLNPSLKTATVSLSSNFSREYDNAYYFSSALKVDLWPEKDFPKMPEIITYYKDVYITKGSTFNITPSSYSATGGLTYSAVKDSSVASTTVSGNKCVVKGLKKGTTTLTITPKGSASSQDVGDTAKVTIHVRNKSVASSGSDESQLVQSDDEEDIVESNTISKSNLKPNAQYVFLLLKGDENDYQLSEDSLLYIDQTTADENGNVNFTYYGDFSEEEWVALICGECNHTLSDWQTVYEPKYTETGLKIKTCTICDEVIELEEIDKLVSENMTGDVNGDGVINVADASMIQKYLVKFVVFSDERQALADTNGDGNVNICDATRIQKYIANLIPSL